MGNYNSKSKVEPEIFAIFQHKVEQVPHFTYVTGVRHISTSMRSDREYVLELATGMTCLNIWRAPNNIWQNGTIKMMLTHIIIVMARQEVTKRLQNRERTVTTVEPIPW